MNLRLFCLLLCSIPVIAFTQSRSTSPGKTQELLRVNNRPVNVDEFIYLYRKNHQNPEEDYTLEKIEEYLTLYLNFKLKVEEARERGMDTTAAFLREFNQYKDELRKPYLPGNGLTDSLAKMAYERMKEEVRASHILVLVGPDASPSDTLRAYNRIVELRKRVTSGEPFEKVASEASEDQSARVNHGDLGYFSALQMVYPFENMAYETPVGELSPPFRTRFGYHVLKVTDRRAARPEVEVSHIMIRTGEGRSDAEAKDKIFSLYDQLQAGHPWSELCKEHSEDVSTRQNGGKLKPFRSGMMSNVPEFESTALELENAGQISDPVRTQYGWHIIRLERKIPLGKYEELAASLKSRVSRDERTQISKQALNARLRSELGFSENKEQVARLLDMPDSVLFRKNKTQTGNAKPPVLFTLGAGTYTLNDFITYAAANAKRMGRKQQYDAFVENALMTIQEEKILRDHPEFRFLINEYYEGILLFEIMEKEVWNKASSDSAGQLSYYQQNMQKYQAGDRVHATIYSASDVAVISSLREKLEDNASASIHEYLSANKIKTESGYFTRDDKAVLRNVPWETGFHQIETNGLYYLAWLKQVLPAGVQSFEEARPNLISDYQNQLEKEWVAALKKKYPVKVNQKGKKYVINTLRKK